MARYKYMDKRDWWSTAMGNRGRVSQRLRAFTQRLFQEGKEASCLLVQRPDDRKVALGHHT